MISTASTLQNLPNYFHNSLKVLQDIVIPKSKHLKSLRLEPTSTPLVFQLNFRFAVLATIYFDDYSGGKTNKVDDVKPIAA